MGVEIKLGTEVTEEMIQSEKPDAVIVATGSRPLMPPIEGLDSANVVTAEDVLYGNVDINPFAPVVVCGGGEVGGETAEFIAEAAFNVTLLEMQPDILNDMVFQNKSVVLELLAKKNVKIITNAKVSSITESCVKYTDASGSENELPAAKVVAAFGYKAHNPLEDIARKNCGEVYVVGSAVKAFIFWAVSQIAGRPFLFIFNEKKKVSAIKAAAYYSVML